MLNVALTPHHTVCGSMLKNMLFVVVVKLSIGAVSTIKSETFGMFVNSSFI